MGQIALQDLNMAGVMWELSESVTTQTAKKTPQQQTFAAPGAATNNKPIIIPAAAPISLDTVKSMVARPNDIDSLIRMVMEFNHPLRGGATNVVMPNIAKKPNGLLIITDMPSSDDDLSGKILSGPAGDLVDKMLSAIEMGRDNVSIIPLIFWRTPGGRSPSREEMDLARPFVDKMIEMLKPRIIVTFGTLAAEEIGKINLNTNHGAEINNDSEYKIIPIYHPNYLILKPSAKKDVWVALQNVQKMLKNP